MIKREKDMTKTVKPNMRGGTGSAEIKELLDVGEYKGAARLVAEITLEPGSSIGEHVHDNEEEIFYILEGVAGYDDNGTRVLLYKGDSCICRAGEKHSLANASATETLRVAAVILTF